MFIETPEAVLPALTAGEGSAAPAATPSVEKTTRELLAYGPQDEIIARSADGGQSWVQTAAGRQRSGSRRALERPYTRSIVALLDERNPQLVRRIVTPFEELYRSRVAAGWAPFEYLMGLGEEAVDALVIPTLQSPERMELLRHVSKTLILDVDAPHGWTLGDREQFDLMIEYADGITAPTRLLASRLRAYHQRVFVWPHLLPRSLWEGFVRPQRKVPVIAIPRQVSGPLDAAISALRQQHGERLQFTPYDWREHYPVAEPEVYCQFDIVILPAVERVQASAAPVLPAMAAGCVVVGGPEWPLIEHRQTGILITRDLAGDWMRELNGLLRHSDGRRRIGAQARRLAMKHTAEAQLGQIFQPYRVLVPERQ